MANPGPNPETPAISAELGHYEHRLANAARGSWAQLSQADVAAAVDAGMLRQASEHSAPRHTDAAAGERTAAEVGRAAATVQRHGLPGTATQPVDWQPFGGVIPVLAASPGAGASITAAVVADIAAHSGWRVQLADTADPARSGLAMATTSEGPVMAGPDPGVDIRCSWRGQILVARLSTALPVVAPGMVPPPRFWLPPQGSTPQVTVVDLGWDSWRLAAHPLTGAGQWLRRGTPTPRPLLVCRASRPGLIHAEQVLARLEHWVSTGAAIPPAQLVISGAKRWPPGVVGTAGRRVAALLETAVFLPWDTAVSASGISAAESPTRLRTALTPLLRRWGVVPALGRSDRDHTATTSKKGSHDARGR